MLRSTACLSVAACLVSGCTFLPTSGPTTRAIVSGADVATAEGVFSRYELIDVDASVVEALRARPLDSLLATFGDRSPSQEPVIGVGDSVAVQVWEAGSGGLFSGPLVADRFSSGSKSALIPEQVVGRDGGISVPYAGRIQVAGRRTQDVQGLIENELQGKAIQPQVLVTVTRPISQSVTVTGEQSSGARIPLSTRGDRLLDVIAAAGGVRGAVNETFVRLSRGPSTVTVPMSTVVSSPRENVFMRAGDVLTLVKDPQTFLALGALNAPTEIPFAAEGITLSQALARVRGLTETAADPEGLFLFRYEPVSLVKRLRPDSAWGATKLVPVVYRVNLRDPQGLFLSQAFRMRNRDLVYASNAPFAEVAKVISVFTQVASPVGSAANIYRIGTL